MNQKVDDLIIIDYVPYLPYYNKSYSRYDVIKCAQYLIKKLNKL